MAVAIDPTAPFSAVSFINARPLASRFELLGLGAGLAASLAAYMAADPEDVLRVGLTGGSAALSPRLGWLDERRGAGGGGRGSGSGGGGMGGARRNLNNNGAGGGSGVIRASYS